MMNNEYELSIMCLLAGVQRGSTGSDVKTRTCPTLAVGISPIPASWVIPRLTTAKYKGEYS